MNSRLRRKGENVIVVLGKLLLELGDAVAGWEEARVRFHGERSRR